MAATAIMRLVATKFPDCCPRERDKRYPILRNHTQRFIADWWIAGDGVTATPGSKPSRASGFEGTADPFRAAAAAVVNVSSWARRVMAGVDRKHSDLLAFDPG